MQKQSSVNLEHGLVLTADGAFRCGNKAKYILIFTKLPNHV